MQTAIAIFPLVLLPSVFGLLYALSRFHPCPQVRITVLLFACRLLSVSNLSFYLCHHSFIPLLPRSVPVSRVSRPIHAALSSLFSLPHIFVLRSYLCTQNMQFRVGWFCVRFSCHVGAGDRWISFVAYRVHFIARCIADFAYLHDLHLRNCADCMHGKSVNDRWKYINTLMDVSSGRHVAIRSVKVTGVMSAQ